VGTGSPNGDDQAGWQFVEMLQRRSDVGVASFAVRDPMQLLDFSRGYERLIIVDACSAGDSPGTIARLEWPDPRITVRHSCSTHRFSVAETLQLAERLGQLPDDVVLFGVEIQRCPPLGKLTDAVSAALVELENRVLVEISEGLPHHVVRDAGQPSRC
jgi:hydrogenase maturation protease